MMIKRFRKEAVLILTGLFCLALFRPVFGQEMTAEQLVSAANQKWNSVQDFQADMKIGMQMAGKMTKMEGTIWQKGKLLRVEMTLPPEIMPQTDKTAEPLKMLMVVDGKTMWQSMPMMKMVMKTDISALEGKIKDAPFSKSLYSLPAVTYRLSEKQRNGNGYYFLETSDIKEFTQKSSVSDLGANLPTNMPFQSIGVWVNKASLFPELIEFYSQENTPGMFVELKNIKIDQGLSPDLFIFKVPEGVQVMDMTAAMKAMTKNSEKQSTASDKTQSATAPNTTQTPK